MPTCGVRFAAISLEAAKARRQRRGVCAQFQRGGDPRGFQFHDVIFSNSWRSTLIATTQLFAMASQHEKYYWLHEFCVGHMYTYCYTDCYLPLFRLWHSRSGMQSCSLRVAEHQSVCQPMISHLDLRHDPECLLIVRLLIVRVDLLNFRHVQLCNLSPMFGKAEAYMADSASA